ncbi:MAG: tetratricopeptide repeat protein, partial [Chloroflexota bacterium]
AVALTPPGSPDLPMYLNNLGNGLSDRYARTGELADLEQAIAHGQQAVALTPPGSPDLPMYLNNLGNGLRDRYARTGELADLEQAIAHWQQAVALTPPDSPALPSRLNNLGIAYINSSKYDDAIAIYDQLIAHDPQYTNAYYNKACAYALMNDVPQACRWLRLAIQMDGETLDLARTDADFDAIRNTPEFQAVLSSHASKDSQT